MGVECEGCGGMRSTEDAVTAARPSWMVCFIWWIISSWLNCAKEGPGVGVGPGGWDSG